MALSYPAVQVVGGLLPGGVVQRIGEGDPEVPGIDPVSYDLAASESVRRLANAKYLYLRDMYTDFTRRRARGAASVARLTRDEWLGPLLRELHYDRYEALPGGIPVEERSFPVSHWWQGTVPMHLLPWHADLDRRVGRAGGPASAAPHAMVQQLLNQSDQHLWAVLSNGQRLRLLRDSTSLVGSSYIEFDLQSIFEGELFADFVLLFRMAHASRLKVRDEEIGPPSCLLEQWRAYGAKQGERALTRLRGGVEVALEILGTGFLDHPANEHLRDVIGTELSLADFKRSLLRLVYKLLFWMVVEDRDLLLDPAADQAAGQRYDAYLSSQRLRKLAMVRRHSRHGDLWQGVKLVFRILGSETGSRTVGLPGIGGIFEHSVLDEPLCGAELTNAALLQAVEALSVLAKRHGGRQLVRCCYGVDLNEMAAELAKVSLWLEAFEPGKPLGYLDANIRVGNSLLGATPAMLRDGIPEAAFVALDGDDRNVVNALRKQNAAERSGQRSFGDAVGVNLDLAEEARAIAHLAPCESLADVHVQAKRAELLDEDRKRARLIADAWCTAFVGPKTERTREYAITHGMLERLAEGKRGGAVEAARQVVETMSRQYRFFHWHIEFPHIFPVPPEGAGVDPETGWKGGFSCILTNPPWEKIELKQEEFFASREQEIAGAEHAAARRQLIKALRTSQRQSGKDLYGELLTAQREVGGVSHLVRASGRYPLTGSGRLNTYAVFAEAGRRLASPRSLLGMILPTGIATDATTQAFFKDVVTSESLVSLHDFENEDKLFEGVDHRVRFALLTLAGAKRRTSEISLAFRARQVTDIASRAYQLTPDEIGLLNPNTGTCPVFLSRQDAEITLGIYRRVPVLWREDDPNGNPWRLWLRQGLFNMATDSGLFRTYHRLIEAGWRLDRNVFVRAGERMLPLYEAKMVHHFDHRLGTYEDATEAQLKVGTLPRLDDDAHRDPAETVLPRYWVAEQEVVDRLAKRWSRGWLLGWRDICRSTDERTLISAVVSRSAVGDKFLLALPGSHPACLQGNLSSLCLDYVVRQKFAGTSLKYYVLKQLPVLPPESYERPVPWDPGALDLATWITARVLELTYTADDLAPYARDLGDDGPPFVWDPRRRELIRAELDAAYFQLYGLSRDEVDYVLDAFTVFRQREERTYGEYRMKRLILECYDAMTRATQARQPLAPTLNPMPGQGPRHPE
ncbi:Eco57I restriction-modification methylase domain-containing protein [Micromonospora avicenniae]|uniref:Eco57I restriction-modification methylase domain-containing protein n=1 Tax=Micromonospora avicenniae TaxID=1198245 RepID=UPI0034173FA3